MKKFPGFELLSIKRIAVFWAVWILLGTVACGGRTAVKTPDHLLTGAKAAQKGVRWYEKGCFQRALEYFFNAHELFTASDQLDGVAMSLNNIGNAYRALEDYQSAVLFYDEAYAFFADIQDAEGMLQTLSNKAAALMDLDRLEPAEQVLNAAKLLAAKRSGTFVPLLNNRGVLMTKTGRYDEAEAILKQALHAVKPEDLFQTATVHFALGNLMQATKQYDRSMVYFSAALTADQALGFYKGIADDLAAMGSVCLEKDDAVNAAKFFKRAIQIYALIGLSGKTGRIMEQLESVAQKADLDIAVTRHFVTLWLEGGAGESPCR